MVGTITIIINCHPKNRFRCKSCEVVPMGDFNFLDICWKNNTSKHKILIWFLTYVENIFLFQKVGDTARGSSTLDLVLISKE